MAPTEMHENEHLKINNDLFSVPKNPVFHATIHFQHRNEVVASFLVLLHIYPLENFEDAKQIHFF